MKYFFSIAVVVFLFSSCAPREEKPIEEKNIEVVPERVLTDTVPVYYSKIRKPESVVVGETYIDTLTFLSFDSNYDYWFGLFLTKKLDTIYMAYDDLIEGNEGVQMVLQWEVDSLYEAGEEEELYYQERLITFERVGGLGSSSN